MNLIDFTNCKSDNEYFDGDDGAKKVLFIIMRSGF